MKKPSGDTVKARAEKRAVVSLAENKTLVELLKAIEQKIHGQWVRGKTTEEREECWFRMRGLSALYVEMKARIDRGTAVEKADHAAAPGEVSERQSPARTPLS